LKNILLLVPRLNIGGAESYVASVAAELQKRGFGVFVASGGGMLADRLRLQGIPQFFLPIRFSTALSAWLLARIVKKHQIDLLHANSAAAGITGVLLKRQYLPALPVIYTAHGVFGHNEKEKLLNECDRILCVSEFVRQDAARKGYAVEKLMTLYNGIDTEKFRPGRSDAAAVRARYGIPADAFAVAIISRIKNLRDKGHADILQIFEQDAAAKNWHLLIIGKGKSLWKIKQRLKKNDLAKRVHCAGHIVDVENYLDAVDAVVLPSQFETFGLVLAEAMAMGKPAVAYAVGGTPEVIKDGVTGYLVERGDTTALAQKLERLAVDQKKCAAMGENGRQWVESRFPCDKMMEELIGIYGQLTAETDGALAKGEKR